MKDIIFYIDKLKKNTSEGKIPWKKFSNAFIWQSLTSNNVRTNVILQKTKTLSGKFSIVFRLFEVDNKKTIFEINTTEASAEIINAIDSLYSTIENSHFSYELNILDDLLKKLD